MKKKWRKEEREKVKFRIKEIVREKKTREDKVSVFHKIYDKDGGFQVK